MTTNSANGSGSSDAVIGVMVVDDSAIVRGLISRILESDSDIKVVSSVGDGIMALNAINRHDIDVVVLDIEMPRMDGLTALPQLIKARPGVKVVMASTLTRRNAEISMKALELGASDYIPKPSSSGGIHSGEEFKRELIEKVRALVDLPARPAESASVAPNRQTAPAPQARVAVTPTSRRAPPPSVTPSAAPSVTLRPAGKASPNIVAIGSSTGGPQALQKVLGNLSASINLPILITQHMPATFTTILAEHISRASGRPCKEAEDGDIVRAGEIYVAPGDFHMTVEKAGADIVIRLNQDPPENFCRPAVDVMLRSVLNVYGSNTLVVILTGMGQDGLIGSTAVADAGGTVISQDEESSVVWGMPGAVANHGVSSAVLPLTAIAARIEEIVGRVAA